MQTADQPAHPRSMISPLLSGCKKCVKNVLDKFSLCTFLIFFRVYVAEQAGSCLAQPDTSFFHINSELGERVLKLHISPQWDSLYLCISYNNIYFYLNR